jgi:hypothetical protein
MWNTYIIYLIVFQFKSDNTGMRNIPKTGTLFERISRIHDMSMVVGNGRMTTNTKTFKNT